MIKFVYIGDQLVEGGKQFCFGFCTKTSEYVIDFLTKYAENVTIFNSWDHFYDVYGKCSMEYWYKNDFSIEDFKSLMPPELLPKEDIICKSIEQRKLGVAFDRIYTIAQELAEEINIGVGDELPLNHAIIHYLDEICQEKPKIRPSQQFKIEACKRRPWLTSSKEELDHEIISEILKYLDKQAGWDNE